MRKVIFSSLLLMALTGAYGWAAERQTDWIEPVAGSREGLLGAEIKAVEPIDGDDGSKVTISIPKTSIEDPEIMNEVIVYGRRPDKSEPRIEIRHEWVANYDKDYYGLILYLGKEGNLPLRLYLKGHDQP